MIGMNVSQFKGLFFDRAVVKNAVDKATRKVLSKFGAFVMTGARRSIADREGFSKPGHPPHSHTGLLKQFIFFAFDPDQRSVVIGPAKLSKGGSVPEVLEYGGTTKVTRDLMLPRRGRCKRIPVGTRLNIAARPYMGPAYEREEPKLPAMWADSVK